MSELNYPNTNTNTNNGNKTMPNMDKAMDRVKDSVKDSVDDMRNTAQNYIDRGTNAVREGSAKLKDSMSQITDRTATYVHEQPVKSVLMAAAAGAAIAILASMITSGRSRH
jgi:ElaB/YqjD/DUF883 family membrane-anchored ribosome-binding protein